MKKTCFTIAIVLFAASIAFGQWTTGTGGVIYYNSGNVGIGTTSPQEAFSVITTAYGTLGLLRSAAGGNLTANEAAGRISFGSFNATTTTELYGPLIFARATQSWVAGTAQGSSLEFWTVPNNSTASVASMRLDQTRGMAIGSYAGLTESSNPAPAGGIIASGNVGIGTSTPLTQLQVVGVTAVSGTSANLDPRDAAGNLSYLANSAQVVIGWNRSEGMGETDFIANQGAGGSGGFSFYNHNNSNVETQLMSILGNGSVIIGTPPELNYNYTLNVGGSARMNLVVVNTSGADFVFAPKYKLMPLSDLGRYVSQNHHLPGIETAKKMQADGLDLGENETKLLQKVEELTLYLVQKDKQLADEGKQLNDQQKELSAEQRKNREQEERLKKVEAEVQEFLKTKQQ